MQKVQPSNVFGIDVSHHQGEIDWTKVDAKYAFIKATEGRSGIDGMFRRNAMGADAVGIPAGFYHYARPENNTVADEVDHFITATNGMKCKLPHVLDIEGAAATLGRDKVTAWAYNWLTQVKRQSNWDVMLYTGASFAKDLCGSSLGEFPLWVAHYGADQPLDNTTWKQWAVFQYSSDGTAAGVNGRVDVNHMEVTFFEKYLKGARRLTQFKDVEAGRWSEEAIATLTSLGLFSGKTADTFDPKAAISREETAVVMYRMLKYLRSKGVKV